MNAETEDADRRLWALIAFLGFGIMVTIEQPQALTGLVVAIVGLFLTILGRPVTHSWLPRVTAGSLPILFGLIWLSGGLTPYGTEPGWLHWLGGIVWCAAGLPLLTRGDRITRRETIAIVAIAGTISAALGIVTYATSLNFGIDVTFLHVSATDALVSGSSPYGSAVSTFDGSPGAPSGAQIVGYPYPPATLVPFAGGTLLADPRLTSLASWLLVLGMVGSATIRSPKPLIPLGAFLGLAALPGWPLVLVSSWTEPFSVAILTIVFIIWRRAVLSSVMLGLALATKQYFITLAPLLIAWRVDQRISRASITAIAATAFIAPVLLWDHLEDTFRSLVTYLLEVEPRTDGSNLKGFASMLGIDLDIPFWLTALAPLTVAAGLGRLVRRRVDLAAAISATLGMAFLLGSQAFANYWLLPAAVMAMAASLEPNEFPRRAAHARTADTPH